MEKLNIKTEKGLQPLAIALAISPACFGNQPITNPRTAVGRLILNYGWLYNVVKKLPANIYTAEGYRH